MPDDTQAIVNELAEEMRVGNMQYSNSDDTFLMITKVEDNGHSQTANVTLYKPAGHISVERMK